MSTEKQKLSPLILDEVWTLMKYATETKDEKISSHDEFFKSMPEHFKWECCVNETLDGSETTSKTESDGIDGDDDDDDDVYAVVSDSGTPFRDRPIHDAANLLVQMGDAKCKEKEAEDKLVKDICDYLDGLSKGIDVKLAAIPRGTSRPPEEVFQTGILSVAYSAFQSKLQNFLGLDESVDKIAIVTHVAKGVAAGLKDSNLPAMHLVSVLAYKFVSDRYQHVLQNYGSVSELAKSMKESTESAD